MSFDKDLKTKFVGNKLYNDVWFKVSSIEEFEFKDFDIVVCTSCEHLKQEVIDNMISKCKNGSLVILQSNNFLEIETILIAR